MKWSAGLGWSLRDDFCSFNTAAAFDPFEKTAFSAVGLNCHLVFVSASVDFTDFSDGGSAWNNFLHGLEWIFPGTKVNHDGDLFVAGFNVEYGSHHEEKSRCRHDAQDFLEHKASLQVSLYL